jgi:hypothetical protein
MTKNFEIRLGGIELTGNGFNYDLHNDYDLAEIAVRDSHHRVLNLRFRKLDENWVKDSDPVELSLIFRDVSYLEFSRQFFQEPFDTVDLMGYKQPGDEDMDWIAGEEECTEDSHLVIFVFGDEYLRVYARESEVMTG